MLRHALRRPPAGFVVCRIVMPTATVVHTFMLQRKEMGAKGVWPTVANVHQIVVFES